MQQFVGDARQRLVEARGVADLMHEPEPQRFGGRDALAREAVAAEAAMAHGADEERHHAERRHADAHFRDREERRFGRDHDVAAGGEAGAAADRAAVHDRDRRLRQGVERDQHVAQRRRRRSRRLRGRLAAARGEVGAGAEMPPAPRSTTMRTLSSAPSAANCCGELVEHALVEGVAAVGPVERHGRDPPRRDVD